MASLEFINIDIAIMTGSGLTAEHGITNMLYNECALKKKVIESSRKVIVLMDESKINKVFPYTFAQLEDIDILITNNKLPENLQKLCDQANTQLIY